MNTLIPLQDVFISELITLEGIFVPVITTTNNTNNNTC